MPKTIPMYSIATLLALFTAYVFSSLFTTAGIFINPAIYAALIVLFTLMAVEYTKAVYKGEE